MATNSEINDAKTSEIENESTLKVQLDATEVEQGRVRRRGSTTASNDKQNGGPVLRTTLKPVKRFRPDSNSDKTNPSPGRKKRIKAGDSTSAASEAGKVKSTNAASATSSIDGKGASVSKDIEKNEKGNASETHGRDGHLPVKKKRVWEQWTVEDKNYFFEAVAAYGKDFEAIHSAIAQKQRKRGEECTAKTKDQVRHLYYRTWTMISKMIDVDAYPSNINRAFQELYAVINYGELRKKLGGNLKKKGVEKLNELIRDGSTSARLKGKNFRIKTPSCRALKKMHPDYQGKEGIHGFPLVSDTRRMKLPSQVTVELCPATMSAWNQVHSIAHNPRLKVRLSVECQLSSLFGYLGRKWRPLSERIMCAANQIQSKNHSIPTQTTSQVASKWDRSLVIQTPPDASVNTRIMVFQVTNSKTHCVVSYALRKSVQSVDKTPSKSETGKSEEKQNDTDGIAETDDHIEDRTTSDLQNECISEPEAVDSCLSSEEECDYDSANEDAVKDSIGQDNTNENLTSLDGGTQTLDTSFTLKSKEWLLSESPARTDVTSAKICSEIDNEKQAEIETGVEFSPEKIDVEKRFESTEKMLVCSTSDSLEATEVTNEKNESPTKIDLQSTVVSDSKLSSEVENSVAAPKEPPLKLFNKSTEKKKRKSFKRSKLFIKTTQSWNKDNCGKTTIAELFMMLGKPSVFKLCYHWLEEASVKCDETAGTENTICNAERPKKISLSSGLMALLQAAELSRQVGTSCTSTSVEAKQAKMKLQSAKTKSTATQCELLKEKTKSDEKSGNTSSNSTSSNPHGRGVSKVLPVETVLVNPSSIPFAFAVPASPADKPRKIAANPNKPVQGTMVSAETMNWLLQRERSRSRQIRKPIVLDRSHNQRLKANNRQMKTFSIVTQGPNKIGFLPSEPVPSTTETSTTTQNSVLQATSTPSNPGSTISIEDWLRLDCDVSALPTSPAVGNLLAQAAKQAGLAPQTPVKQTENTSSEKSVENLAPISTAAQEIPSPATLPNNTPTSTDTSVLRTDLTEDVLPSTSVTSTSTPLVADHSVTASISQPNPLLTVSISSSVLTDSTVVNSLPDISWSGSDILSSNFTIMNDNFIERLVNGEVTSSDVRTTQNSDLAVLDTSTSELTTENGAKILDGQPSSWCTDVTGLGGLLDTPQKILPSDSEDSFDGLIQRRNTSFNKVKSSNVAITNDLSLSTIFEISKDHPKVTLLDRTSSSCSTATDSVVDLQLQSLMNENSVDLVRKFQELVKHTELPEELVNDDNAQDGHSHEKTNFQTENSMKQLSLSNDKG